MGVQERVGCRFLMPLTFKSNSKTTNDFDKKLLSQSLVGAKDIDDLFRKEKLITDLKLTKLRQTPIKGNYDYEHLKAIHKELFKDIYVWAGVDRYDIGYRNVFRKGNTEFTHGERLPKIANGLFDALKDENYFKELNREALVKSLASFLNGINILHPFREGNGRTQRLFIEELVKNSGHILNLSNVNQNIMIQASIQGAKGNIKGFEIIIKERLILNVKNTYKGEKMIQPKPFKFVCPKCGYSKTVRPESDVLNSTDFINICPKCGEKMEKTSLNTIENFIGKLFR